MPSLCCWENFPYKNKTDLPIIFVVYIVSDVFEILHVRLYDETPKQGKVWVYKIVNLHKTPAGTVDHATLRV